MTDTADQNGVQTRQRAMATEHLLFQLIEYVEAKHPGLLEQLEGSLDHLGDPAHDDTKDDAAVQAIARKMLASAKAETA